MAPVRIGSTITREVGMALAVLALWMLSLLVPLHQASGVLREAARAGHDISAAWPICITLAQDEDGEGRLPSVCPAHGIGKNDVGPPPLPVPVARPATVARDLRFPVERSAPAGRPRFRPGRPRGPPTVV